MQENETTEFKEDYSDRLIRSVVAFLNTSGGTIYVGIRDGGSVCGVENVDALTRKITQELIENVCPDTVHLVRISPVDMDGKNVIRITVMEGIDKPYYLRRAGVSSRGVFVRKGASSVPITDSALMKMLRDGAPIKFESAMSMVQDLTFEAAARVFSEHGVAFGDSQRRSLGFFTDSGAYTNLALILSDQNSHEVRMAAYSSAYKESIIARRESSGSVLKQLNETMEFISSMNRTRTEITGLVHEDTRQYPEIAVREAVVNALIHRDYSMDGPTLVSFIGNDLIVTSLGGLPPRIGMEDLKLGISSPRNPKLASIFQRLGLVEAYGTGIPRILSCYKDSTLEPRIETSENAFKITLPPADFRVDDPVMKEAIKVLSNSGPMSRKDLETSLAVSRSKMTNVLNQLISYGIVVSEGDGRNTRYRLA